MYEVGTITYSLPDLNIRKRGQVAHDIFRRGGGKGDIGLRQWGMWPIIFSKGGIFLQKIKHLRFIHITSYSIINIHQVFMLIEISKIQFIGTKEVKSFHKPCGHEPYWRLILVLNYKFNNFIRVVFSHLKLWVKIVRHNSKMGGSKCVKI